MPQVQIEDGRKQQGTTFVKVYQSDVTLQPNVSFW